MLNKNYDVYLNNPFSLSTEPKVRVDNKMPSHYPKYYDYADIEVDNKMLPTPTAFPETDLSGILIAVGLIATLVTICLLVLVIASKLSSRLF